ncbi:8374_t:CDS:2 [Entrophospora sp. SA101]|nr:12910_t:CDS:2 [Entrophospora sp. SA101]CAJ0751474.1 8374_t:CDS:2 [Entrophospora sp. SA101]CAJ0836664.1 17772_t:CDS:2 [Entrophospora sp. SA101]
MIAHEILEITNSVFTFLGFAGIARQTILQKLGQGDSHACSLTKLYFVNIEQQFAEITLLRTCGESLERLHGVYGEIRSLSSYRKFLEHGAQEPYTNNNYQQQTSSIKIRRFNSFAKESTNNRNNNLEDDMEGMTLIGDNEDIDRINSIHYYYCLSWKSAFSSPVSKILEEGGSVLDVCCGNGVWIHELASRYQSSKFTGIDISPIFPAEIKPRNVNFLKGNILEGLPYIDNNFDFVNLRFMLRYFNIFEWNDIILHELFRVTKDGGWIEASFLFIMDTDLLPYNMGDKTRDFITKYLKIFEPNLNYDITLKQVVDLLYSCYKNKSVVFIEEKDNAWYPYKHEETGKTINIAQEILISLRKKMGNSLESEEEDYSVLMNEIYNELITNQTYGKSYRILIQKVNNSNNNNNNNNNSLRLSHSV